jgi:hypothetical protein
MLSSSGGFTTPTAPLSSTSSDRTASFSPSPIMSTSHRPSENSVFLVDDDDLSSLSSHSMYRPDSYSDELFTLSDVRKSIIIPSQRCTSNSSSTSSLPHDSLHVHGSSSTSSRIPSSTSVHSSSNIFKSTEDQNSSTHVHSLTVEKQVESSMDTLKQLITSSMQIPTEINDDQDDDSSVSYSFF